MSHNHDAKYILSIGVDAIVLLKITKERELKHPFILLINLSSKIIKFVIIVTQFCLSFRIDFDTHSLEPKAYRVWMSTNLNIKAVRVF